jgi:hypothetical protein
MRREELEELHYITHLSNLPSILLRGILSHNNAKKLGHISVASQTIQDRRDPKVVPGGRKLHDYVNTYFHARNPMMYLILKQQDHLNITVLRINTNILEFPNVVITDGNAAGDYTIFRASSRGLAIVDKELTFAINWTHPDAIEYFRRKSAKCAEVLVPDRIAPEYIHGAYVSCEEAKAAFEATGANIPVTINPHLFFR